MSARMQDIVQATYSSAQEARQALAGLSITHHLRARDDLPAEHGNRLWTTSQARSCGVDSWEKGVETAG
jgi:hypothetical protein